jgi:hypothetical protein
MTDSEKNMVLRTVYLPQDLDQSLKNLAFTMSISKGELMRLIVEKGLKVLHEIGVRSLSDLKAGERLNAGLGLDIGEILGRQQASGKLKQALSNETVVKAALSAAGAEAADPAVEAWFLEARNRKAFGM